MTIRGAGLVIAIAATSAVFAGDYGIVGGVVTEDRNSLSYLHTVRFLNTGTVVNEESAGEYAGKSWSWRCSGAVVSPRLIATAAHCFPEAFFVEENKNSPVLRKVSFSKVKGEVFYRLSAKEDFFRGASVAKVVRHPSFSDDWIYKSPNAWNPSLPVNDVALVLLQEPVPYDKKAVRIVSPNYKYGIETRFLLAGYGSSGQNAENDIPTLRSAAVPFGKPLANSADIFIGEGSFDKPSEIKDPRGACRGDSGGPVFLVKGNEAVLAAVIARGPGADHGGCLSSVTIATDLRAYDEWIREVSQLLVEGYP
jgi:hypothetical protein